MSELIKTPSEEVSEDDVKKLYQQKMLLDMDDLFEKMMKSKEMEVLVDKQLHAFLSTTKGRIINALGFSNDYIKPIIMNIVVSMHKDMSSLFKEVYIKNKFIATSSIK